ncbi:hypothetical protein NO995_17040 [Aestuariibaculum sp. M13]|uniref:hypothetical protein n=1 Tax=unclassified Aestuariibaculum TaxID=2646735 RepID=UPI00215A0863|nr:MULTISPECIES: hypothetical protein [unclassified Aestuariibaculum]MCR8669395.1 hypothetical protein [Aestuariibaculum sp. M13]WMI65259.1 hypothetical protein RBH94_14480 [Aestuariibaculum sp. YM273]
MTTEDLNKLKEDLNALKIKSIEKNKASKKDQETIELQIQIMTNNMIKNYNLIHYDGGIKMESYKTKFFIHDVEMIIIDQENETNE